MTDDERGAMARAVAARRRLRRVQTGSTTCLPSGFERRRIVQERRREREGERVCVCVSQVNFQLRATELSHVLSPSPLSKLAPPRARPSVCEREREGKGVLATEIESPTRPHSPTCRDDGASGEKDGGTTERESDDSLGSRCRTRERTTTGATAIGEAARRLGRTLPLRSFVRG